MYGKIFTSIYEGTLASRGCWEALVTFQQMIVLANRHGELDMTPEALTRRTTIPLDIILKGIEALEQPDPYSRSEGQEGRRIVRLDDHRPWGWQLVNYEKYCKIQSAEDRREYFRLQKQEQRIAKQALSTDVHNVHTMSTDVHNVTDIDVDVNVKTKPCADPSGPHGSVSSQIIIETEAVARVWDYYIQNLAKSPRLLSFTAGRKQKGLARLRECLTKTGGDLVKAEGLMRLAVDALAASAFHRGENDRKRRYDSWEKHLFKSQEQLESWLECT